MQMSLMKSCVRMQMSADDDTAAFRVDYLFFSLIFSVSDVTVVYQY